jgi:hypothetical protein
MIFYLAILVLLQWISAAPSVDELVFGNQVRSRLEASLVMNTEDSSVSSYPQNHGLYTLECSPFNVTSTTTSVSCDYQVPKIYHGIRDIIIPRIGEQPVIGVFKNGYKTTTVFVYLSVVKGSIDFDVEEFDVASYQVALMDSYRTYILFINPLQSPKGSLFQSITNSTAPTTPCLARRRRMARISQLPESPLQSPRS